MLNATRKPSEKPNIKYMFMGISRKGTLEPKEREEHIAQSNATPDKAIRLALQDSRIYAFQILKPAVKKVKEGPPKEPPTVYIGTEIFTPGDLAKRGVDEVTIQNITRGDVLYIVKAKNGELYPLYNGDTVYDPNDEEVYRTFDDRLTDRKRREWTPKL